MRGALNTERHTGQLNPDSTVAASEGSDPQAADAMFVGFGWSQQKPKIYHGCCAYSGVRAVPVGFSDGTQHTAAQISTPTGLSRRRGVGVDVPHGMYGGISCETISRQTSTIPLLVQYPN